MHIDTDTVIRFRRRDDSTTAHHIEAVFIETPLTVERQIQPIDPIEEGDRDWEASWGVWDNRIADWAQLPGQTDAGKHFDTRAEAVAFVRENLYALLSN